MFIEEITYGTFVGGQANGTIAFMVDFGGEQAYQDELLDIVEAILKHPKGATKAVFFTGVFTDRNSLDILTLLRALKARGYRVAAVCDGSYYFSWFSSLDYLITDLHSNRFVGFECNEIWFHLKEDGQDELTLAELSREPSMFVVPYEDVTPTGLFRFLKEAKHPWRVWLMPEKPYSEPVDYTEVLDA